MNELKKEMDIESIKHKLFSSIINNFNDLDLDEYLDYFRSHNYLLNKRVKVYINQQPFIGEVVGIDQYFNIQIHSGDMLLHIDSGEIEII